MRKITIDPRVIKHLGSDLITSSEVAIIELIKNSIDAKATSIALKIYNNCMPDSLQQNISIRDIVPEKYLRLPLLLVEDNGIGMTDQTVDEGFLIVGTNIKAKSADDSLGEKGIGRLATQRLGKALLVETASAYENHTTYAFIDWENIISGSRDVPSFNGPAANPHTRLWIFDINLEDYIDNVAQFNQLSLGSYTKDIQVNRNLKSALNFLISPFAITNDSNSKPQIDFFFDEQKVDVEFPFDTLALAESTHQFSFADNGNTVVKCGLSLTPWFIERVHRALAKSEAFTRLKKPHQFYKDMLDKKSSRIRNTLTISLSKTDLHELFFRILTDFYAIGDNVEKKDAFDSFLNEKATAAVQELSKIAPISGEIYSFKQGAAIGDKIVIDSAYDLKCTQKRYSLNELKRFLEDYNGVKLYRGIYRIGFLGNKESDWIKLQQFRTKGQQWYRFDLGNTVGYVSLADAEQSHIQEISSRLDISENKTSEAFKLLINVVFNYLFYDLNRKANDLIKVFLNEEGLLEENISKRVKKNDAALKEMMQRNKRMQKALISVSEQLAKSEKIGDTDQRSLSAKSYSYLTQTIDSLTKDVHSDSAVQESTAALLSEADAQLKAIEVESYNNYKLMANGLITETITHELHSLSKTGIVPDASAHFDILKDYFVQNAEVKIYNQHVEPIKNSYNNISGKLDQVGNLYSFLETTFIKKGTYDEFIYQNIKGIVDNISGNMVSTIRKERVTITCETADLSWFVPKGVLLHVFYNLINNSLYWIDIRRKWARSDGSYITNSDDEIVIEEHGIDGLIVSDTGTGVAKSMEDILFEPLQSGKPLSEGRGMGLYIVRKLLNSFGGEIELLDDRNAYGNRYKFLLICNASGDK